MQDEVNPASWESPMTERKPAGMRFESWAERQIREAQERGEFDNLAGAGKPLSGLTGHYDEMWWVKQVVQREHLSVLPPMLALRKEAEALLTGLSDMPSESAVRDQVDDYNVRVVAAIRQPRDGPLVSIPRRLDVDEVVGEWKRQRAARPTPVPPRAAVEVTHSSVSRIRWWRRLRAKARR
jgi:Domain of unknown function (DUF1992)